MAFGAYLLLAFSLLTEPARFGWWTQEGGGGG